MDSDNALYKSAHNWRDAALKYLETRRARPAKSDGSHLHDASGIASGAVGSAAVLVIAASVLMPTAFASPVDDGWYELALGCAVCGGLGLAHRPPSAGPQLRERSGWWMGPWVASARTLGARSHRTEVMPSTSQSAISIVYILYSPRNHLSQSCRTHTCLILQGVFSYPIS